MSTTMMLIVASTAVIIATVVIENVAITNNENVAIVDVEVIVIEVDEGDIFSCVVTEETPIEVDERAAQSVKESFILVQDDNLIIDILCEEDPSNSSAIAGPAPKASIAAIITPTATMNFTRLYSRYLLLDRTGLLSLAFFSYSLSITYMRGLGMIYMDHFLQNPVRGRLITLQLASRELEGVTPTHPAAESGNVLRNLGYKLGV